jgi:hypothetical protein
MKYLSQGRFPLNNSYVTTAESYIDTDKYLLIFAAAADKITICVNSLQVLQISSSCEIILSAAISRRQYLI